ncbi:DUF308 domain-containing protein [[Clostridium] leptum]|uniref:DUF308 domain-containing protein n=1 Tax=Solibaculum mannosilyticum TaxID=2780922 RepID=A0A7I8D191_9FIRM|nr:DUF308 domain-containing protein [Solibaculum mannosilyticum]MCO7137579.1 DUF308 domain-containing protein [[Clostridium] leptum]BCI60560.1 hypothetical protein C12CBH8_11990 [Solibaculum mannosilyticum]
MKTTEKESGNLRMGMMFLSICYIAIGAILLIFPNIALTDLCYALGILFMISGVINVAWYLIKKGYLVPGRFGFAFGVTQVMVGLYAVIKTQDFAFAFAQVLAICMMLDSIMKSQFSMDLLRLKAEKWWALLLVSLTMIGLSMLILVDPFSTEGSRNLYTYIVLILDGAANIISLLILSVWQKRYLQATHTEKEE